MKEFESIKKNIAIAKKAVAIYRNSANWDEERLAKQLQESIDSCEFGILEYESDGDEGWFPVIFDAHTSITLNTLYSFVENPPKILDTKSMTAKMKAAATIAKKYCGSYDMTENRLARSLEETCDEYFAALAEYRVGLEMAETERVILWSFSRAMLNPLYDSVQKEAV